MTTPAPDKDRLARALSLHQSGRRDEAEERYRALLAAEPGNAEAWHLLALLLAETGRREDAAAAIAEAIARRPDEAMFRFTAGTIALGGGTTDAAIAAFEAALELKPRFVEAASNLGLAFAKAGRAAEAEAAHRQAASIDPGSAVARYNLGQSLHRSGRPGEAIAEYRAALLSAPGHLPARLNLALALREAGEYRAAEIEYQHAIAQSPSAAEGWLGLGLALKDRGDFAGAVDAFGEALRRNPISPDAHLNLALALLTLGRFEEAWPHYEQRWNAAPLVNHRRAFGVPEWDGNALGSRRLLVHAEQGLGDTIQFAHLLPQLGADPAQLVFEVPALLMPLLAPFARHATLVAKGTTLPRVDCHCALMDLPRRLGLTLGRIRPMTDILAADPARIERWRHRLGGGGGRLIAIAWRGGADNPENDRRSIDPALLRPLFEHPDLRFVSLQKGTASPHPRVIDPGSEFDPPGAAFLDSAAIMTVADAVVTVDTALAHLAGALGRPGWILLAHVADWRWLAGRTDCLWYPALRLARQPIPGGWAPAVERVREALTVGPQA